MARAGEYMGLDDCRALLKKCCSFLADSDVDCADFRFTEVSDVFGMVSFIDNSYILVDENLGLKIRDIGSGDVSPKFEHPFHLIRHSKGRIVEYTRAPRTVGYLGVIVASIPLISALAHLIIAFQKQKLYLLIKSFYRAWYSYERRCEFSGYT